MNLFAALLLSHLVADFPLQTNQIYKMKNESTLGIALHAAIHMFLAAFLIQHPLQAWPLLASLGIIHFLIDLVKVRAPQKPQAVSFVLDQIAHLLVLWGLARYWALATTSILAPSVLLPLILYGSFLALLVFLWVLAQDLSSGSLSNHAYIRWGRAYLLQISQYAGWPLVLLLIVYWYRSRGYTV